MCFPKALKPKPDAKKREIPKLTKASKAKKVIDQSQSISADSSDFISDSKKETSKLNLCPIQTSQKKKPKKNKNGIIAKPPTPKKAVTPGPALTQKSVETVLPARWSNVEKNKQPQLQRKKSDPKNNKDKESTVDKSNHSLYFTVVTEQFENAQAVPLSIDVKKALGHHRGSNYLYDPDEADEDDTLAYVSNEMPTILFPPLDSNPEPEVTRTKKKFSTDRTQEE